MKDRVTVRYPDGRELSYPVDGESLVCGAAADADVRLADGTVAPHHLRIRKSGGKYVLEDLGSAAGTRLNGRSVEPSRPQELYCGDLIQAGGVEVCLESALDATLIEPLPTGSGVEPAANAARLWQLQAGLGQEASPAVRLGEGAAGVPRPGVQPIRYPPGFEERVMRARPRRVESAPALHRLWRLPWGGLFQLLGGALVAGSLLVLVVILFA